MEKIYIDTEYIKLGQLLKFANVIDSGAMAKEFLDNNIVYVNNEQEQRRGKKIYPGYIIKVMNKEILVEAK